ncbi:SGNH hydrolase domain-containing protein [Nocardioides nanhaiensis]|uniref:SGNH domain-containing protein n=1 Tax=Nocardioides nanhaiensis TaxID=1476871 RepID=A0ABP8WC66_9ACTN
MPAQPVEPAARPRATRSLRSTSAPLAVAGLVAGLLLALLPGLASGAGAQEPTPARESTQQGLPLFPSPQPPSQSEQIDEAALSRDYPRLPKSCGLLVDGQVPAAPRKCVIKRSGARQPVLVMWGDSHMWQMLPAVKAAMKGQKMGLVAFLFGSCPPAMPDMRIYAGNPCMETQQVALRYLEAAKRQGRDVRVILGAFWGAHLNRLAFYESATQRRQLADRRAYVMKYTRPLFGWLAKQRIPTDVQVQGPAAVPPAPNCRPGPTPFQCDIARSKALFRDAEVTGFLKRNVKRLPRGSRLINFHSGVCRPAVCPAVQPSGAHTWFDPYHLSASTTAGLGRFYLPSVRKLAR